MPLLANGHCMFPQRIKKVQWLINNPKSPFLFHFQKLPYGKVFSNFLKLRNSFLQKGKYTPLAGADLLKNSNRSSKKLLTTLSQMKKPWKQNNLVQCLFSTWKISLLPHLFILVMKLKKNSKKSNKNPICFLKKTLHVF